MKNKKQKIIVGILTFIISIIFCTIMYSVLGEYGMDPSWTYTEVEKGVGGTYSLNADNLYFATNILCAESTQLIYPSTYYDPYGEIYYYPKSTYVVKNVVTIKGNVSTDAWGRQYSSKVNGVLNSILQHTRATGFVPWEYVYAPYSQSEVQNAVWSYMLTWLNNIGYHYELSGFSTSTVTYYPSKAQELINEGNAYANSLGSNDITNNTSVNNISLNYYESNNNTYVRVGPFKFGYGGSLKNISIYGDENREITNLTYGKYVGSSYQQISESSITSGMNFYIDIKMEDWLTQITKVKVQSESNVKQVRITFLASTGDVNTQHLLIYNPSTDVEEKSKDFNIVIPLRGKMDILKKDATTGKLMANVGFTLQAKSGVKNGQYVSIKNGKAEYTSTPTTIKTDANGKIHIDNMYPGTYELIETVNPHYGYEDLPKVIDSNIIVNPGATKTVTGLNKRMYIKLSGYVWEDIVKNDKQSKRNGLYKNDASDTEDKLVANVTVKLKNSSGQVIKQADTDSNGRYQFIDVKIDDLPNLYIEFTYNGMTYTNVVVRTNVANGSKASEGQERTKFNEEYSIITKGQSQNSNESKTHDISYDTGDHTSTLDFGSGIKYGYSGATKPINYTDEQYLIQSTTYNGYNGYLDKIKTPDQIRNETIEEITNINLGLYEREQPDIAVIKDIESARVTINGYEHTYKYAERFNNKNEYGDGFETTVKFGQKYGSMSYTRELYPSDIKYTGDKSLEVWLTYKISFKNQATTVTAIINEFEDYYDKKYSSIKVGKEINDNGTIKDGTGINSQTATTSSSTYNKVVVKPNLTVEPQKEGVVYVELQVTPQNIIDIVDNGVDVKLDNVTEVTSYSTRDSNGNVYAGIDVDSAPGNLNPDDKNTYEDDTDQAPGMLLKLGEERKVSGDVFEDATSAELVTGEVRQGDGLFGSGDKNIKDVDVRLVDLSGNTVKIYQGGDTWVDATTKTNENGEYSFQGYIPGKYYIEFKWGDNTYRVQNYKNTIVDKDSYDSKLNNLEWYKENADTRESDALDNYETRQRIDAERTEETYGIKDKINNTYNDSYTGEKFIDKMTSDTPAFNIKVEYMGSNNDETTGTTNIRDEYETDENGVLKVDSNGKIIRKNNSLNDIKNVDFGIAERARQVLKLEKRVATIKITLANGNVLINDEIGEDGKLKNSSKYLTYIPEFVDSNGVVTSKGQVKMEIDSEILQGSTLEIGYAYKVTNISEVEYLTQEFNNYGRGYGETNIVKLSTNKIVDYVDNDAAIENVEGQSWAIEINKNDLINNGLLKDTTEIKNILNNTDLVITKTDLSTIALEPTQSTTTTLTTTKLLANTIDEIEVDNDAEIINVGRNGGRELIVIPGNYVPGETDTMEYDDDQAETVIILPPTGLTTDVIRNVIISLSVLVAIATGIIIFKIYKRRK